MSSKIIGESDVLTLYLNEPTWMDVIINVLNEGW